MGLKGILLAGLAVLGGGAALAQSAPQALAVAPGVVVVVEPTGAAAPVAAMPDPFAMMQQMQAQMQAQMSAMMAAAAQDNAAEIEQAAASGTDATAQNGASVMVTSISNGNESCTRREVISPDGKSQVSETGNGCAALMGGAAGPAAPSGGMAPVALPDAVAPKPAVPQTVIARAASPMMVADRD
jgi:hypothetical protein